MVGINEKPQENGKAPFGMDGAFISPFGLLTMLVIVVCFFYVDHTWSQSQIMNTVAENFTSGDDNITADRIRVVNASSTIARFALAFWGCICFLAASQTRVNFSSLFLWSMAAVAVFVIASVLWSEKPTQTIFKLTALGVMTTGALGVGTRFQLREVLTIVTCVCVTFIVIGVLAEISQGYFRPGRNYRFIGTTHPNIEAIFASLVCLISRLFLSKLGWGNLIGISLLSFGMLVVWYTKSRTTLAGLLFSLMVTQMLVVRGPNRVLLIAAFITLASLGLAASTMISQSSSGEFGKLATMFREDDVSSLSGRIPLWEELLNSASKKPLLGYGYLAFWTSEKVEYLSATFRWEIPHGHNLYLDVLLDGGIVGLSLVGLTILLAFMESAKLYSTKNQIEYAILFGILAYAGFNGLAESLFKLPNFPLFVVLACCFSMLTERVESS